MPPFLHFLSLEAVYILTFDLEQDLCQVAEKVIFDTDSHEWVNAEADMTNLDYIIQWISMIYHRSRMKSANEDLKNIIIVGRDLE